MIKGFFPALFLVVSSCCMMKAKETQGNTLMRPLMTRTAPPPLPCRGSGACFDYFSTPLCKYKIRRAEEIMPGSCRAPSLHGRKTEKAETGTFHQQTGNPGHHAVPRGGTHSIPETRSRQAAGAGKSKRFRRRGKQAVLTDSLPRSLPGETSNHGAKATY